jgi:hypothetical protein
MDDGRLRITAFGKGESRQSQARYVETGLIGSPFDRHIEKSV